MWAELVCFKWNKFRSRLYLSPQESLCAPHSTSQKSPQFCLWKQFLRYLTDRVPVSSFQYRSSSSGDFCTFVLQVMDYVMSLAFCLQVPSRIHLEHFHCICGCCLVGRSRPNPSRPTFAYLTSWKQCSVWFLHCLTDPLMLLQCIVCACLHPLTVWYHVMSTFEKIQIVFWMVSKYSFFSVFFLHEWFLHICRFWFLSSFQNSLLVKCQIRDRKVVSLSPGRSGRIIFFSRVNFVCWLLFSIHSIMCYRSVT